MDAVGPETKVKSNRFTVPALRYILVTWLLVLGTVGYLDRTNISIAGIQIGRQLGIDNIHLGWIFSAFLIGYAAFQIPGGGKRAAQAHRSHGNIAQTANPIYNWN
jgi:MFS family permease